MDPNLQNNANLSQPATTPEVLPNPPDQSRRVPRYVKVGIDGLAIILLIVLAAWIVNLHRSHQPQTQQRLAALHYTYNQTDNYSLSDLDSGSGIYFVKPAQFKSIPSISYDPTLFPQGFSADFAHIGDSVDPKAILGGLSALMVPGSSSDSDLHYAAQHATSLSANDSRYVDYTNHIKGFLLAGADSDQLELGKPQTFTNQYIKDNAWQFSYTRRSSSSYIVTGEAVYIIGPKADFYFGIATPDFNWQNNQTVWGQVLGSLQIKN